VVAEIEIGVVAVGVLDVVPNVRLTVAGKLETEAEGEKMHVTPAGMPLAGQAKVTVPLNDPKPLTTNAIGEDVDPRDTLMLEGLGAPNVKSTTCNTTAIS
jgi:hypothetical protein